MKLGMIGLPQAGKKTLFQALTGSAVHEAGGSPKPVPGAADIVDQRFDNLVAMYQPKKEARARIDLVLLPRIEQETIAKGDIFRDISDVDALCHVVRAFEDDSIYHAAGSVDPLRDVETVNAELLLHDQVFQEKRIERLEADLKKVKSERQARELDLLRRMQAHLEDERPLRLMALDEEDDLLIRSYPLLTRKAMILVFNVDEDQADSGALSGQIRDLCVAGKMEAMTVPAKVEAEIALLDNDKERQEFRRDLGIGQSALEALTLLCLKALGRISFFTVGKDEVRQWLVRANATAPAAAGIIHTDLQKGFIRAEVMQYDELIALGSEAELKKAGKLYVQGKDYVVADGDILNIRFNI